MELRRFWRSGCSKPVGRGAGPWMCGYRFAPLDEAGEQAP
jgi:hypothetical protein